MQKTVTAPKATNTPTIAPAETKVLATTTNNQTPAVTTPDQVQASKPEEPKVLPKAKTLQELNEKLKKANSKVEFYNEFCTKLERAENFFSRLDGSGLHLIISNQQGHELHFTNQSMITDFIANAIEQGKEAKGKMEVELLMMEF
jgi:hypothetical protein